MKVGSSVDKPFLFSEKISSMVYKWCSIRWLSTVKSVSLSLENMRIPFDWMIFRFSHLALFVCIHHHDIVLVLSMWHFRTKENNSVEIVLVASRISVRGCSMQELRWISIFISYARSDDWLFLPAVIKIGTETCGWSWSIIQSLSRERKRNGYWWMIILGNHSQTNGWFTRTMLYNVWQSSSFRSSNSSKWSWKWFK